MTAYNIKSAHPTRTIKVDIFADGQTLHRIPLCISDGSHSIVLHFKPEEITERGPEVASVLDKALDCYIARMRSPTEVKLSDPIARPFLVGPASPPSAAGHPGAALVRGESCRPENDLLPAKP